MFLPPHASTRARRVTAQVCDPSTKKLWAAVQGRHRRGDWHLMGRQPGDSSVRVHRKPAAVRCEENLAAQNNCLSMAGARRVPPMGDVARQTKAVSGSFCVLLLIGSVAQAASDP